MNTQRMGATLLRYIFISFLFITLLYGAGDKSVKKVIQDEELFVPGKVIVKFKKQNDYGSVNKFAKEKISTQFGLQKEEALFRKAKNLEIKQQLNLDNVFVYETPQVTDIKALIKELNVNPLVEYAEPVYIVKSTTVPNDPLYSQQQHLPKVFAEEAWDIQTGDPNIIIAVLDTGVDWDHEDLAGVIWTNEGEIPDNGIDDDGNGFIDDIRGWDFVDNVNGSGPLDAHPLEDGDTPDNNPMDVHGHGTHVAGIAGAHTNNETGIASVASGVSIMPLRIGWLTNDGNGYSNSLFMSQAFIYAADNGAHIANLSFGNYGQAVIDAAYYAFLNGVLIVDAAGNSNSQNPTALGEQHWTISVASINSNDTKSSFSNYGEYIAISAPGSNILSTIVEPSDFYGGNKYVKFSGTSMAAPLVASVAGLVKSKYPEFDVLQLHSQVVESADNIDVANPNYSGMLGSGRVNAERALTENINPKPLFKLSSITIEETSGNSNGILEPGESANLILELESIWAAGTNINAVLSIENDWPVEIENTHYLIPEVKSILETGISKVTISFPINCLSDAFPTTLNFKLDFSGNDFEQTIDFSLGVSPLVLFVADFEDADDREYDFSSFYIDDFNSQKVAYEYVHRKKTEVTFDMLSKYKVVVWACEWAFPSLTEEDREAIAQYLDNGGALFISGQDIGWDLNENEDNRDISFYNNYLKAKYIKDDANQSFISGIEDDPISDGLYSEFYQIRRNFNSQYPDEISAIGGSVPMLKFENGSVGAIRYRGEYDLVYFAFGGYESILDEQVRHEILKRLLKWFAKIEYSLQVITDTEDTGSDIEVNLDIETEKSIDYVKLYYTINKTFPPAVIEMTNKGGGSYTAFIPPQNEDADVSYFVYIKPKEGVGLLTETVTFHRGTDLIPPSVEVLSNPIRNSINREGISPFELEVKLEDNLGIDKETAKIHYWVNDETPKSNLLMQVSENIFSGTFSFNTRLELGDQVSYYFSVNDISSNSNISTSNTFRYTIDTVQIVDDFEFPQLDWELTGTWGLSSAQKKSGKYSLSDSPDGFYESNTNSTATYLVPFDLSPYVVGKISYYLKSSIEIGVDSLLLELSCDDGETWQIIDPVSQNYVLFTKRVVDISNFVGENNFNVKLRFRFYSNETNNTNGVFIDDIVISVEPDPSTSVKNLEKIPFSYKLEQNYPNPFNPSTTINFAVPVQSNVKIIIFNVLGEIVEILHDKNINAGVYSLIFDASKKLSSGIYFYQIIANGTDGSNYNQTKKMILLK